MHALCFCLSTLNVTEDSALVADLCLIAYSRVFPVLLSLAVVTNVLNAVVLLSPHPGGRFQPTPIRKYLLWITLSHCVICATVLLGIWVRDRVGLSYSWAFYFAHFEQPLYDVFNCSYAWIIVGLSRDRHQAVCRPHQYTVAASHARAAWRIALAYAFSALVYAPHCFAQEPVFRRARGLARNRGRSVQQQGMGGVGGAVPGSPPPRARSHPGGTQHQDPGGGVAPRELQRQARGAPWRLPQP
nr:uncharacterized protein LOC113822122 [Penaeus vannamei]